LDRINTVIHAVDAACSRFRQDSEIVALASEAGERTALSPLLAGALRAALNAAEATDGLVDPTIGGSLRHAGYDRDLADIVARPDDVTGIPAPGWHTINLDDEARTVWMPAGLELDVGAIGKAYAADLAADQLADVLGCGVLVSFGGDISVAGKPPVNGWAVRVTERPDDIDLRQPGQTVLVDAGGIASSSTELRQWRRGRRVFHHILDPSTGLPAARVWRTVTVAAETCVDANTASTAAVILGALALEWLYDRGLPARLVRADGHVVRVGGWPAGATAVVA
jgi:thiamine biosynthesis lipoprotein